jgi:hypothetical protein
VKHTRVRQAVRRSDEGSSLVEVLVSAAIMTTLAAGLMAMAGVALTQSENQGHLAARTAEYAQDKMEQLLVLAYGDTTSDTRQYPSAAAGGTGLAVGGSNNAATPVAGYVDYLDVRGNLLASAAGAAPAGWFYMRVWQINALSASLKEVRVTATVARGIGRQATPTATLITLKTFPF